MLSVGGKEHIDGATGHFEALTGGVEGESGGEEVIFCSDLVGLLAPDQQGTQGKTDPHTLHGLTITEI